MDEKVKELGEEIFNLFNSHRRLETALDITTGALEGSQGVVKELEEGIKRHRQIKITRGMTFWEGDIELYKLIEEKP